MKTKTSSILRKREAARILESMDDFTRGHAECLLWSETEDDGAPLNRERTLEDINPQTLRQMVSDCKDFQDSTADLLSAATDDDKYDYKRAGHDFALTRNRHGAGFWDRGLGDIGSKLTEACRSYGSFNLYVGDDGVIYGA